MTACAAGAGKRREGEALSLIYIVLYLPKEDIKPEGMTGRRSIVVHTCGVHSSGISRCVCALPSGGLQLRSGRCKARGGRAAMVH